MNPTDEQIAKLKDRMLSRSVETYGCLLWQGCLNKHGYGNIRWAGQTWLVHRLGWLIYKGQLPVLNVLHSCDIPNCWKADHLYEGDQNNNIQDMIAKGRANLRRIGVNNPKALLTEDDVRQIRILCLGNSTNIDIGHKFGVTGETVRLIRNRRIWSHVT